MDALHVSLDIHMYKDKMIILITLFCIDLIGPNPKLCHLKPYFSFPIASVLNKVVFEEELETTEDMPPSQCLNFSFPCS